MKDGPTEPPTFRTDLFHEAPPVWRDAEPRQALRTAPAELAGRVMATAREAGDDGGA